MKYVLAAVYSLVCLASAYCFYVCFGMLLEDQRNKLGRAKQKDGRGQNNQNDG